MAADSKAAINRKAADEKRATAGFTLIELVVILVIAGVLAVVVLLRFDTGQTSVGYQADRLARDIRHTQMLAVAWGRSLRMTTAATSYQVVCVSAGSTPCNVSPVRDPASGEPFTVTMQNGVTLSLASLDFDFLGRPVVAGSLTTSDVMYTLTGGGKTSTVTVRPLTGFVVVTY